MVLMFVFPTMFWQIPARVARYYTARDIIDEVYPYFLCHQIFSDLGSKAMVIHFTNNRVIIQ